MVQVDGVVATDAGMLALWSPSAFQDVVDYDTWETALLDDEDIARHVEVGAFVPVNIGFDGVYHVLARVGTPDASADLTERERRYLVVRSEPYLLVSDGVSVVSGIEHVDADGTGGVQGLRVPVPAGRWRVVVALIAWADEPGQRDDSGLPLPTALPDFALLINEEADQVGPYRREIATFDR